MTEWEATGVVLGASPFGEADIVLSTLTEAHGLHRGLVRGGASRRHRANWEVGNVVRLRWRARLADQLGSLTGEPVGVPHAGLTDRPIDLALLASSCAVAAGALSERVPCPDVYAELLLLLARLGQTASPPISLLVRWELTLLTELGFGLALDRCTVSGLRDELVFVSPRTGRAVTAAVAAGWEARLLRLPPFLFGADETEPAPEACLDGLMLTGHFLAREVFGARHNDLPHARLRLQDMVRRLVEKERDGQEADLDEPRV